MIAQLAVFIGTATVGTLLLIINMAIHYQAEAMLETAAALKFRSKVEVQRVEIPIVIAAPSVQGSGVFIRHEQRVTPAFARENQFAAK